MEKKEIVAFYNTENLFDTLKDAGKNDSEFLPNSPKHWTKDRYNTKINHISEVIYKLGRNDVPMLMGLAEVENKHVLFDLTRHERLKSNAEFVHFESDDSRGIDVALLYNKRKFQPYLEKKIPIRVSSEPNFSTRDILYVKGKADNDEMLHVFVNHWPSRREGFRHSRHRRISAAMRLKKEIAAIFEEEPQAKIIVMGDFNDDPNSVSFNDVLKPKKSTPIGDFDLLNLAYQPFKEGKGSSSSSKFGFSLFDQILISKKLTEESGYFTPYQSMIIFDHQFLKFYDKKQHRFFPNRTYKGIRYYGGYSDHYPVFFTLHKHTK